MDSGSVSETIDKEFKLNGENYEAWSTKIRCLLEEQGVLGGLTSGMAKPEEGLTSNVEAYEVWRKKNSTARVILLSAMDDEIAEEFCSYENVMDMWIALKRKFGDVSLMKLRALIFKFDNYKMPYNHMIKVHLSVMSNMMRELSDLGWKMTGEQKVQAVFCSLPNSWILDDMQMNLIRNEIKKTFGDVARHLEVGENRLTSINTSKSLNSQRRDMKEAMMKSRRESLEKRRRVVKEAIMKSRLESLRRSRDMHMTMVKSRVESLKRRRMDMIKTMKNSRLESLKSRYKNCKGLTSNEN